MKINENVSENSNASVPEKTAPALAEGNPKKVGWDQIYSQSAKTPEYHNNPKTPSQPSERFSGLKIIFVLIVAILFFGLGFVVGHQWEIRDDQTPEITEQIIATKIEDCSELATSKLSYNGFVRYEQGNIPFINRKAFAMGYRADVSAGVDLSQAQVVVEGRDIKVKLPASTIQTIKIDPNSIEFYDSEYSLFAWDNKEDTVEAEGIPGLAVFEEILRADGSCQKHIIVKIDEMLTQSADAVKVKLYGVGAECGQIFLGDIVLMPDNVKLWCINIEPGGQVPPCDKVNPADPGSKGFHRPEPILQVVPVTIAHL